jgi:hypothetical protein
MNEQCTDRRTGKWIIPSNALAIVTVPVSHGRTPTLCAQRLANLKGEDTRKKHKVSICPNMQDMAPSLPKEQCAKGTGFFMSKNS